VGAASKIRDCVALGREITNLERLLRLITQAELDRMKELDNGGRGKQIAAHLGLPEPDHAAIRDGFRHRILSLALEAYRREEISRGKLTELAAMLGISRDEIDSLIEDAGLDDDSFVAESER
jgi:hypothetical protein